MAGIHPMTTYLLDTNHLSPLVTIGHPLRERLLAERQAGHQFALPAPVLNEFLFGIATVPRALANLREWEVLQVGFICYVVDQEDAKRSFDLRLSLRRRGWQLELVDSFTAALALRYDLTVLTTDRDFTAVPLLKLDNWW